MNKEKTLYFFTFFIIFFININGKSFSQDLFEIESKEVQYNKKDDLIIAEGEAIAFNQFGKKIKANKIIYYKNKDLIKAIGN